MASATGLSKEYLFENDQTRPYIYENVLPSETQKHYVNLDILEIIRKIANEILLTKSSVSSPIEKPLLFTCISCNDDKFTFKTLEPSNLSVIKDKTITIFRTDDEEKFNDISILYRKLLTLREEIKTDKAPTKPEETKKKSLFSNKYCFWISMFISVYAALMIGKVLSTKKG
ncbi:MAG: hypothetical protein JXA94_02395 [Parachlamydiales bacterium]|nr:hypothetical protein [Parachlamydiales bacterium]